MRKIASQHPSEYQECRALMQWCDTLGNQIPELKPPRIFHIPNGGKRNPRTGAILKQLGTWPGVADYFWMFNYSGVNGIFIEMKKISKKPSQNQLNFMLDCTAAKYLYILCEGWRHAAKWMCWHLLTGKAIDQRKYDILTKEL